MATPTRPRLIHLFLAQYFYPLVFIISWIITLYRPYIHYVTNLHSDTEAKLNKTRPPTFIAHISDLHLSDVNLPLTSAVWQIVHTIDTQIKPITCIISGDITEGGSGRGKFSIHAQFERNWIPFKQIKEDHPDLQIIAAAGNHDMSLVPSVEHKTHMYNNFVNDGNASKFFFNTFKYDTDEGRIKVTIYNPFHFPVPPLPLYLFAQPTTEQLDRLESELQDDDVLFNIVVCHYPIISTSKAVSSRGQTLETILVNESNKVRMFLTGHLHIKHYYYHRYNNTLEVIGVPPMMGNYVGLLGIDNNVTTYSCVDLDEEYIYAMTIPPDKLQFSGQTPYIGPDFRCRITVFTTEKLNLTLTIDGEYIGRMEIDAVKNNSITYGLDCHAEVGEHKLELAGDINMEREFIIGPDSKPELEYGVTFYLHFNQMALCTAFAHVWVTLLCVLPTILDTFFAPTLRKYGDWIFRTEPKRLVTFKAPFKRTKTVASYCTSGICNLMKTFTIGYFYTIWRFHQTPAKLKGMYYVMFVTTLMFPAYFQKSEDSTNIVWFFGFQNKKHLLPDLYCSLQYLLILAGIMIPLHYIIGFTAESYRWSKYLSIDFILCTIPIYFFLWLFAALPLMGGGWFSMITSPTFYRLLLFTICILRMCLNEMTRFVIPEVKTKQE